MALGPTEVLTAMSAKNIPGPMSKVDHLKANIELIF
jgi:hypothetical protein